jgi:hypothetical protein
VDDLQHRGLLHRPIDRLTVRTDPGFPALGVDLLAYLCPSEVVNVRSSQVLQEGPPLIFGQQNPSAVLDSVSVPPVALQAASHTLHISCRMVMTIFRYPTWNAGRASLT